MGRLEEGMGNRRWGGVGAGNGEQRPGRIERDQMILTRSCPHGAGQHPGVGEAAHSHHQQPQSPQAVWVGSGEGVQTFQAPQHGRIL